MNTELFELLSDNKTKEFYYKIKNDLDEVELLVLSDGIKKLIKKTKKDNLEEQITLLYNTIVYNINKLVIFTSDDVNETLYISKQTIILESYILNKLNRILKSQENTNELLADIYLLINALIYIQIDIMNAYSYVLKRDECINKGITYFSNKDINIENKKDQMEKIYEYVNNLSIKKF